MAVNTQDQAFVNNYSSVMYMLATEGLSKVRGIFEEEDMQGEKHFFDRLGKLTVSKIASRNQILDGQDPDHTRRMATVSRYYGRVYLDTLDKLKMLTDPTSNYAIKLAEAHGESYDGVVYNAMLGSAATGKDGDGTQAFDSNNAIVHGGAGLTVAKFNQALRIFEENDINIEIRKLYMTARGLGVEDLLSEQKFTSFDYQGDKALSGPRLPSFRGVNLLRTNRVPDHTAGSVYRALMFTEQAVKVAKSHAFDLKNDVRTDMAHVHQITSYEMLGAVRMEENQVVDINFQ